MPSYFSRIMDSILGLSYGALDPARTQLRYRDRNASVIDAPLSTNRLWFYIDDLIIFSKTFDSHVEQLLRLFKGFAN
jgi:hypothetical protein